MEFHSFVIIMPYVRRTSCSVVLRSKLHYAFIWRVQSHFEVTFHECSFFCSEQLFFFTSALINRRSRNLWLVVHPSAVTIGKLPQRCCRCMQLSETRFNSCCLAHGCYFETQFHTVYFSSMSRQTVKKAFHSPKNKKPKIFGRYRVHSTMVMLRNVTRPHGDADEAIKFLRKYTQWRDLTTTATAAVELLSKCRCSSVRCYYCWDGFPSRSR